MSEEDPGADTPHVRRAKGAAQAAIGKLIGDDAEIRAGRDEQAAAKRSADEQNKEQE